MGSLLAHNIRKHTTDIPITLLMSNTNRVKAFEKENNTIKVIQHRNLNIDVLESQFDANYRPPFDSHGMPIPIENLVISTKAYQTTTALKPYLPHLSHKSNILILQNGMGMAEKLCENYWPLQHDRPNIFQAVSTHGAYRTSPYVVHHSSPGKLLVARIPCKEHEEKEYPDFIKTIIETPGANAIALPYNDHLLVQMQKLVGNACINPLTAVLDCLNGDLLYGDSVIGILQSIIKETREVFFAEYPQLKQIAAARAVLDNEKLLESVLELCKATKNNSSSMREDVRNLNTTEISAINGYIVELGRKHKIATPTNKMLMGMVRTKLSINKGVEKDAMNRTMLSV